MTPYNTLFVDFPPFPATSVTDVVRSETSARRYGTVISVQT